LFKIERSQGNKFLKVLAVCIEGSFILLKGESGFPAAFVQNRYPDLIGCLTAKGNCFIIPDFLIVGCFEEEHADRGSVQHNAAAESGDSGS